MYLKLVSTHGKTEVRYKGPNISPGYWRAPEPTAKAFDEEGFFAPGMPLSELTMASYTPV